VCVLLLFLFVALYSVFNKQPAREPEITFSEFVTAVEKGDIADIVVEGDTIKGKFLNMERFRTHVPKHPELSQMLLDHHVKVTAKPEPGEPWIVWSWSWLVPSLVLGVLVVCLWKVVPKRVPLTFYPDPEHSWNGSSLP